MGQRLRGGDEHPQVLADTLIQARRAQLPGGEPQDGGNDPARVERIGLPDTTAGSSSHPRSLGDLEPLSADNADEHGPVYAGQPLHQETSGVSDSAP